MLTLNEASVFVHERNRVWAYGNKILRILRLTAPSLCMLCGFCFVMLVFSVYSASVR
jgi:hypothetical protein